MGELFDRLTSIENLRLAWEQVAANRGAPGVDEVSIARFARRWEENLYHLRGSLRANTYRPRRLRHFFVPKGPGSSRRISILTVTDRVAQRAALNVLDGVFEPRFLSCSYGYRRQRSVAHAVRALVRHRDSGRRWLLDADIEAFFDSVDRELLLARLREGVDDPSLLKLIDNWLRAMPFGRGKGKGLALGAVISPLLANIYLHPLDQALARARWATVRYADDFVVLCTSRQQAEHARGVVDQVLAGLRLQLNLAKTSVTSFDDGFQFLGVRFRGDRYEYTWQNTRVEASGDFPGWLYAYGPGYE